MRVGNSTPLHILVGLSICAGISCGRSPQSAGNRAAWSPLIDPGSIQFSKLQIESAFRAEGVTTFDVNRAGTINIVTRQFWYEYPPDVSTRHEISTPRTWNPATDYSDSYADWQMDVDRDGWPDFIALPRQHGDIYWYQNPQGVEGDWNSYLIANNTVSERPVFADLFGDGNKELVFEKENPTVLLWAVPDSDPTQPWVTHDISLRGQAYLGFDHHGVGVGDVNGDGRLDVIISAGWFEGPEDPNQTPWVFHPENWLSPGCLDPNSCCSDMYAYDMNGDGLPDIVCASPHNRGRWWFEQGAGDSWTVHQIDIDFSESHAVRFEDLDGDGVPEIITGKRWYAHGTGGEGANEPSVLVYYKLRQDSGGVTWDRFDIDPDQSSGVGTDFQVADVNGDGLPDIIISNKHGLFYFEQIPGGGN